MFELFTVCVQQTDMVNTLMCLSSQVYVSYFSILLDTFIDSVPVSFGNLYFLWLICDWPIQRPVAAILVSQC